MLIFDPKSVADELLESANTFSDNFSIISENAAVGTIHYSLTETNGNQNSSARVASKTDKVVEEKNYFLQEYGVIYRTEGYTSDGKIKDIEHNFYELTDNGLLVLKSSHYRSNEYSDAYNLTYIEHSDIFFENYTIQGSR